MNNKIDITSTALEKGIDAAKEFLGKLVSPAIEETGLLLRDKVTFWRYKNQVKMINKAKEFCLKNNINPKNIPIKFLSPILEYSSLEDDDILTEKWAILLSNMVDSEQNIENHVFPHLLSQLSKNEFELIETAVNITIAERIELKSELKKLEIKTKEESETLKVAIGKLSKEISNLKDETHESKYKLESEKWSLERKLREVTKDQDKIKSKIAEPPYIFSSSLEEYELANLIRLGIVRSISRHYAYVENSRLSYHHYDESVSLDDIEISVEPDFDEYVVTQLGEIFIDVCTEKNKKST